MDGGDRLRTVGTFSAGSYSLPPSRQPNTGLVDSPLVK